MDPRLRAGVVVVLSNSTRDVECSGTVGRSKMEKSDIIEGDKSYPEEIESLFIVCLERSGVVVFW